MSGRVTRDAWLAYRYVHRGHTAAHRLAYVLRTAGLTVTAPELPEYAVFVERLTPEVATILGSPDRAARSHLRCTWREPDGRQRRNRG